MSVISYDSLEKIRMLICSPTMLNLPYTSDTESEKEELIEVSHHQNSPPKELPSYPDNILPTSLETMSPLPHNYSNKCISVDPGLSEALLGPLGNFPCSTSQLPISTRLQRTRRLPSRFKNFEMWKQWNADHLVLRGTINQNKS